MVTVVFHWGVHPEHNREFQDTLDEVMNWFKAQPGFLMGIVGRDTYNYNEMLSCLEWQSKEHADRAYAQWEGTPWFRRLQSFLVRPTSFVTYDNVGTFMSKGASLPWSTSTSTSTTERPTRLAAREMGMTKSAAGVRERRAGGASTATSRIPEARGTKRDPVARPSERTMGAESRVPRGKTSAESKASRAKTTAESPAPRSKGLGESTGTRSKMSAESRAPREKRRAKS